VSGGRRGCGWCWRAGHWVRYYHLPPMPLIVGIRIVPQVAQGLTGPRHHIRQVAGVVLHSCTRAPRGAQQVLIPCLQRGRLTQHGGSCVLSKAEEPVGVQQTGTTPWPDVQVRLSMGAVSIAHPPPRKSMCQQCPTCCSTHCHPCPAAGHSAGNPPQTCSMALKAAGFLRTTPGCLQLPPVQGRCCCCQPGSCEGSHGCLGWCWHLMCFQHLVYHV
jgi:hypothetical protein